MSAALARSTAEAGLSPASAGRRLSRHAVLPPIKPDDVPREVSAPSAVNRKPSKKLTPFSLPPGDEVFAVREKERLKEREDWAYERTLKVHEKGTYSSRMKSMLAGLRKQVMTMESKSEVADGLSDKPGSSALQEDTDFVLTTTRDRHLEKEDLSSYINRKREMFLVQYSLGVKKDEIGKLIAIREAEEKKLEAAEQYIELSATVFDEFLKENDKAAVEAIKKAEQATKAKLEKVAEIKRLNAHLVAIKNEMSRNNDLIMELRTYKNFLDNLTTDEIRDQWKATRDTAKNGKEEEEEEEEEREEEEEEGREVEVAELYFTAPSQLMNVFTELEEQNLSLIQNSQETEVTLEELRQNRQAVEKTMNKEIDNLKHHIDLMKLNIAHEEEKACELEIKSNPHYFQFCKDPKCTFHYICSFYRAYSIHKHTSKHVRVHLSLPPAATRMYSYGEYKAEDQDYMLAQLDKKVADVYSKCIGTNEASIPTLQMLAAIESRMEELFETMESLPPDKIEAAEKAKEKERRMRMREEKLEEQRAAQEERLRRALERAQADPKKRVGRKLVYRSEPPVLKRKHADKDERKEKEEEEMQYFFS